MCKKSFRFSVMIMLVLGLFVPGAAGAAVAIPEADVSSAANSSPALTSPQGLLNLDGTLKLDNGFSGSLNLSGWEVQMDPRRGPLFSRPAAPAAAPLTGGDWAAVGTGGSGALDSWVNAIAIMGTDVYVGGAFRDAGHLTSADFIARWNGTTWSALGSMPGGQAAINGTVYSLAVSPGGTTLYVGGYFTDAGGNASADYVAQWSGSAWSPLGDDGYSDGCIDNGVDALAVTASGVVYAGGQFTYVEENGETLNAARGLAMWNPSNGDWSAVGHGTSADDPSILGNVTAIAIDGSKVYVGGWFSDVRDGATTLYAADYIAMWYGGHWNALGNKGGAAPVHGSIGSGVEAIAVDALGNVYAAGFFSNVMNHDGTTVGAADYVAKWDPVSEHWSNIGATEANDGVFENGLEAIAIDPSGDVYVGGSFNYFLGTGDPAQFVWATDIARWHAGAWEMVGSDGSGHGVFSGADVNGVGAIAISGTSVYVGGDFRETRQDGTWIPGATHIARLNKSTGNWSAVGAAQGSINGEVYAVAINAGIVYVGGDFEDVYDQGDRVDHACHIAKWDGTHWSSMGTDTACVVNDTVYAITAYGTDVYVGGNFTEIGFNLKAGYIAKWTETGGWSELGNNGSGYPALDGPVNAIAVYGSDVYVGGSFNQVNTGSGPLNGSAKVARWDGYAWHGLPNATGTPQAIQNGNVRALAVDSNGYLYAGGDFTYLNLADGASHNEAGHIAMWNGSAWSALGYGATTGDPALNAAVYAIVTHAADVYVGGEFTDVDNLGTPLGAADYIAKWNGSAWSAVGSGSGGGASLNDMVRALTWAGNNLFVGGEFTNVENPGGAIAEADYVAQWDGSAWRAVGVGAANGAIRSPATAKVKALAGTGMQLYVGGYFFDAFNGATKLAYADYLAAYNPRWTISGNARIPGTVLSYTDGTAKKVTAGSNGTYTLTVRYNWSGNVTPSKSGCAFTPVKRSYTNVRTHQTGQNYAVNCTLTYQSAGAYDGWVLESGENTNAGGTLNSSAATFFVGDNAAKKQYRGVLSFNTSALPDQAVITKLQLKIGKQAVAGGGNPFSIFQGMTVDIKKGYFSSAAALQAGDFQAAPGKLGLGAFTPTPSAGVYTITLPSTAYPIVNKLTTNSGLTQLRLRFKLDDNNNTVANYISFYSGNAASANRPVLSITFHVP